MSLSLLFLQCTFSSLCLRTCLSLLACVQPIIKPNGLYGLDLAVEYSLRAFWLITYSTGIDWLTHGLQAYAEEIHKYRKMHPVKLQYANQSIN